MNTESLEGLAPTFTIIMPNLNGAKYLERSCRAVLNQAGVHFELCIVDGLSTDGSHEILGNLQKEFGAKLVWLRDRDIGISNAVNIALGKTAGRYIGYLGSDDFLIPETLAKMALIFEAASPDFIFTDSINYHLHRGATAIQRFTSSPFNRDFMIRYGTPVGLQNVFFNRHFLMKFMLDETNRYCMDYELFFRIIKGDFKAFHWPEITTVNMFDNNITSDPDGKQRAEAIAVAKRYSGDYSGPNWWDPVPTRKARITTRFKNKLIRMFS